MAHAKKTIAKEDAEIRELLLTAKPALMDAAFARLASRKIAQYFTMDEARAVIRSLRLPKGWCGGWDKLAERLVAEWGRQQPTRLARKGEQGYLTVARETVLDKLAKARSAQVEHDTRKAVKQNFGEIHFGEFVKGVFADQVINVLAELQHEKRSWRIEWLDVAAKPCISALIRVTVLNEQMEEKGTGLFLLFKVPGSSRIKAIETGGVTTCKHAFAGEVPEMALTLKAKGFTFRTDFENQVMVATSPDGLELPLHWQGKALCTG
jgi:hypothetical protein